MSVKEHPDTVASLDSTEASNLNFTHETPSTKEAFKNTIFQVPESDTHYQAAEQGEEQKYHDKGLRLTRGFNSIRSRFTRRRNQVYSRPGAERDDPNETESNHHHSSYQTETGRRRRRLLPRLSALATWKWEMLALLISILCMAAIIGILAAMKDQRSTAWHVGSITINAAINFLSTVSSMTLGFAVPACFDQEKWRYLKQTKRHRLQHFTLLDRGSGGPVGAIRVIWSIRWRLTALASVVIILDVFTGFMLQQSVKIGSASEYINNDNSPAFYTYTESFGTTVHVSTEDAQSSLGFSMQAAIFRGLSETSWSKSYTCGSNCTWPASQLVLGFDSACSNVTAQTDNISQIAALSRQSSGVLNLTTPGGVVFPYMWQTGASSGRVTAASLKTNTLGATAMAANGSFMQVAFLNDSYFGYYSEDSIYVVGPSTPEIVECTWSLVAWNYSLVTSDESNLNIGSRALIPLVDGVYQQSGTGFITTTASHINYTAGGHDFFVSMDAVEPLQNFFASSAFEGNVDYGVGHGAGVGVIPAFMNASFSDVMDRVAQSMTDSLQQNATQRAYGLMQVDFNYFRVYWAWVSLPVAVQFLALVLLICTILRNEEAGETGQVPMWKSSRTVLLFHHFNEENDLLCDVQDLKELEDMEKTMETRLGY
ncbi:hypothetical protein V8C40DRAFT_284141 [Trichoderma camerunense]